MKTKRMALLISICLLLVMLLAGCTQQEQTPTAETNYQSAIALLQEGRYAEAGSLFSSLGHYYDASRYAMYSNALASAESGSYAIAASSMAALNGFMDSGILSVYYSGRHYESIEDYESALEQYTGILQYGDVGERVAAIPGKISERDYKAARALEEGGSYEKAISAYKALNGYSDSEARIISLTEKINASAYAAAEALEASGKLKEALAAFRALGDYSDSAERASAAAAAIDASEKAEKYKSALLSEQNDDPVSAYALYTALGDYEDCPSRAAAIREEAMYRSAFLSVSNGQYEAARASYLELGEYKDSAEKARLLGVCALASECKGLNDGVVAFKLQGVWGYVDLVNNFDVAPAYDSISPFSEATDLAVVSAEQYDTVYYGLVNRRGRVVTHNAYLDIAEGMDGYYTAVTKGSRYAYNFILINSDGDELSVWQKLGNAYNTDAASRYNNYRLSGPSFTNGVMIAVDANGRYGLINDQGQTVISGASEISLITRTKANDTALVYRDSTGYQLTALDGSPLDENTWRDFSGFQSGFAAVRDANGLWGYISQKDCHIAIEPQYQGAGDFSDGYAGVKVGQAWGFIDAQNNMVIQPRYYEVDSFKNGCAAVRDYNIGWQVIDKTGKLLYFKQNAYLAADAMDQYGNYEAAIAAFEDLDGYADSEDRALQSREKINATVYATAEQYEAAGEYIKAAETFEWLGDYSDAPARASAARETQNANTYASAAALEENGQLEEAIAIYLTLGEYRGSAQHAADLRESINQGICARADELETAEKYEEAIAVLSQIPEYTGVAGHVSALEEKIHVRDYNAAAALEDAGRFEEAIAAFTAMGDYADAADRITVIQGKILEREYNAAAALEENGKYEEAITAFTALADYSDSAERITVIQGKILERDYNAAAALEENGKYEEAITAFAALADYSDSADRITAIQGKILERDYNAAAALEENGEFTKAYDAFIALGDYSDSADRAVAVVEKAAEQQRQMAYAAAAAAEENNELENAEAGFTALGDYSDAPARAAAVQEKIRARDYAEAKAAMNSEDFASAVALFTALGNYQDSADLLVQSQTGLRYQTAVADALAGKMKQAYDAFTALGDYRDSARKAEICGNVSRGSRIIQITKGVLTYEFHKLWGVANLNTNVITAAKYDSITFDKSKNYSKHNLMYVYLSGGDHYSYWGATYANMKDSFGYINLNGEEVIPCRYFAVSDFNPEGCCTVALVKPENRYGDSYYIRFHYGIMDYTGKTITSPQWRTMGPNTNSRWDSYENDNQWNYSWCSSAMPEFVNGRMKVQNSDGYWGFIDTAGKTLGEVKWYSVGDFSDGMAMVSEAFYVKSGYSKKAVYKYGFIDEQGQTIGEVRWDAVEAFSYGYAAVQENGYWGFINKKNELVIPCQYTEVASFKEDGTCDVKTKQGTWQVIDTSGEVSFF